MRTFVACFVLAAAVAMPGIVVAATSSSSSGHWAPYGVGTATATAVQTAPYAPRGPINPALRPAVDAVKAAFAAKGIELTVEPVGGDAAWAFDIGSSARCPISITFQMGGDGGVVMSDLGRGDCGSRGFRRRRHVTVVYSPSTIAPTIDRALENLPR